ncbi:MAG: MFS transporter [Microthrixaceae bacterium]
MGPDRPTEPEVPEGSDPDIDPATAVAIEAPGVDEETVLPWSLLIRRARRFREQVPSAADPADDLEGRPGWFRWLITWTVLLGALGIASSITILAVSRPSIADDLGTSASTLVWLISGPTIAVGLTGTTAGKLGDLHGHRRVYLVGIFGAAVFSVLAALAWSGGSLIAFRVIGATIGAATGPSSLAIINQLFARRDRSKALGFWSLVMAGGPVLGLVIGGPLVEAVGWRAIFWFQTPLLLGAALVALVVLPETRRHHDVHFDVLGQVALVVSLAGLLLAIDRASVWGFTNRWVLLGIVVCPLGAWWFVRVERRVEFPLIPLHWFKRRGFSVPVAVSFFIQFGYMGGFILTPKLLAEVRGLGAETIALMMVPRPLTFAIAGPIAGYMAHRISARATVVGGLLSLVASLSTFAFVSSDPKTVVVVVALTLSGFGIGAAQPRIASAVANSVQDQDLGIAGATQQLVAQVGTTVGMNGLEAMQVATVGSAGLAGSYPERLCVGCGRSHSDGRGAGHAPGGPGDLSAARIGSRRIGATVTVDRERPPRTSTGARQQSLVARVAQSAGHLLDRGGDLLSVGGCFGIGGGPLHGHELGHVALDLDLACHERLHACLWISVHEDGLGRRVVECDGEFGIPEVAQVHVHLTGGGVHVGVDGPVAERHLGHDLVHLDLVRGAGLVGTQILSDLLGFFDTHRS